MNELCLFAGGGGGLLGSLLLGWKTVCYVEREPYCIEILKQRIADGILHDAPIWDDVRTFDGKPWRGCVDIVTAGFPCQPFSAAGKQLGEADERNAWPDTIRILREVRPRWALLENVPALASSEYFLRILGDLAESGFDCRWDVFSAAGVGAPHIRKRLWIVAHSASQRGDSRRAECEGQQRQAAFVGNSGDVGRSGVAATCTTSSGKQNSGISDADGSRLEERQREDPGGTGADCRAQPAGGDWWATEPDVGRVASRVASRVDRLRAIGNGQVPYCMVRAWVELSGEFA